jgi:signal transduction histidine kinase
MSIRTRLLAYFGLMVAFGAVSFVVLWLYGVPALGVEGVDSREYRRAIIAVEALADKERDSFERWFGERRRELQIVSATEDVAITVTALGSGRTPRRELQILRKRLERLLTMVKEANPGAYNYLYVLEPASGRLLAASESASAKVAAEHQLLLREAAQPGLAELVSIINESDGPAVLVTRQIAGIDEESAPSGTLPGLLVASVALGAPLQNDETSMRQTLGSFGAALLIDRNHKVLFTSAATTQSQDAGFVAEYAVSGTEGVKLLTIPGGDELIAVFRHLHLGASDGLSLVMTRGTDEVLAASRASFIRLVGLGALMFLCAMGLVVFAANRLAASEARIRELNSHLEDRVEERTHELGVANEHLRETLEHLESTRDGLVRSEKLAALGALVAGVAHELNTPIGNALLVATSLQAEAESFTSTVSKPLTRVALDHHLETEAAGADMLVSNLERAAELVRGFKQLAADQTSEQRRRFVLAEAVEEVMLAMRPALKRTAFEVSVDVPPDLDMDSYPGPLTQILINFMNNALLHAFEGRDEGRMTLAIRAAPGERVEIVFSDNGCGMSAEVVTHVFDPFFTTKLGHGGSGLGMHMAFNSVTKILGGTIDVDSAPGQGTRWKLSLPRVGP